MTTKQSIIEAMAAIIEKVEGLSDDIESADDLTDDEADALSDALSTVRYHANEAINKAKGV